jgi:hypothetical protein
VFAEAVLNEGVDRVLDIYVTANRRRRRAHDGSKGPVSGGLARARLVSTQQSSRARKEGDGQ